MQYTITKLPSGGQGILPDSKTIARLTKNNNKRIICTLNKTESFHAALMPIKDGGHYIYTSNALLKKLHLKIGAQVSATFKPDDTEYQFPVPEELAEVLATDPDADKIFQHLTPGNQRGLMHLVNMVKSPDKRVERALLIAKRIKEGITAPARVMKK